MKYTSPHFQLHYLQNYTLLVKTDFIHDTLLVLDEQQEVKVLYVYPSNVPDSEAMKLLGLPFQRVHVNLPLQSLVFIPTEVFQEDDQEIYQEFLSDNLINRTYTYSLSSLGITACYQYDVLLLERWRHIFPEAVFCTDFQAVLRHTQAYVPLQGEVLGANFRDTQVDLYAFINGQLRIYQTFEMAGVDDLHYFVLSLFKTLDIQGEAQKCLVSGVAHDHVYVDALRKFSHQLEFISPKNTWKTDRADLLLEIERLGIVLDSETICAL